LEDSSLDGVVLAHPGGATLTGRELLARVDQQIREWASVIDDGPVIMSTAMGEFEDWVRLTAGAIAGRQLQWNLSSAGSESQVSGVPSSVASETPAAAVSYTSLDASASTPVMTGRNDGDEKVDAILTIWREVLNNDTLSADADFFEAGGNSMQAIQVLARVKRTFGSRVSASQMFKTPTALEFSRSLSFKSTSNPEVLDGARA
jgi:iturin family lipopeptide synthetase A